MPAIYIKNMVCNRCITAVSRVLKDSGISYKHIELGEVEINEKLSYEEKENLNSALHKLGFELLDDKKSKLIHRIKTLLISLVHYTPEQKPLHMRYSAYLEEKTKVSYAILSKLFSEVEGITIEQYLISQKAERIKELLMYDELSVSEIASVLGYSSVAHLSGQFRKVTGLSPSGFKKLHKEARRKALDQV